MLLSPFLWGGPLHDMPIINPVLTFPPELLLKAQDMRVVFFEVSNVPKDFSVDPDAGEASAGVAISVLNSLDIKGLKLLDQAGIAAVLMVADRADEQAFKKHAASARLMRATTDGKFAAATQMLAALGLPWSQAAVMGVDWDDLALMRNAAFSCAPADAHVEVKAVAHHVSKAARGCGAVRAFCDLLLTASGRYAGLLEACAK